MKDPDTEPFQQLFPVITNLLLRPIDVEFIFMVLSILLLLGMSALISGSEVAFFSLKPVDIERLRSQNSRSSIRVLNLIESPKRLLATILVANNFVNVSIIIIATLLTINWYDFSSSPVLAFIIQVVIITSLILLFGEILPKILATHNGLAYAQAVVPVIRFLDVLFSPISNLLVRSTSFIDRRIERKGHDISLSELGKAIEITTDNTTPEGERKILKGIVKFGDIDVKEIMKSRVDVFAVSNSVKFDQLLSFILYAGYSRIPVYQDTFDTVVGILYIKDLLPYLNESPDFAWQTLLRSPFFVPESKKINDLLQEFRLKKIHMAVVVDEYGGTSGIVTLEDIIEEIVGEINDEFDIESEELVYSRIDDRTYIFEGKTLLNDFYKIMDIDDNLFDPVKGESDTLAGLLLELMGKIPERDESIRYSGFTFKVESADKRRIKRIRVCIE